MTRKIFSILACVFVLLLLLSSTDNVVFSQGPTLPEKPYEVTITATSITGGFTYQGSLKVNGAQANGNYDLRFDLYDSPASGSLLGTDYLDLFNVPVVNGLFTVKLDFNSLVGTNLFTGDARWLHIGVRPAGTVAYTFLSPNQELTAVPYALSLMPGATIQGKLYQTLIVQNYAPAGGVPAAVSGAIYTAADGAGVHGINYINTAGATGMGVWGRTYAPEGAGVYGNGYNGADGVHGVGTAGGSGLVGTSEWGTTLMLFGQGSFIAAWRNQTELKFWVDGDGNVRADGTYSSPANDLAEYIPATGSLQPGDVVEIDPDHPGQFRLAATPNSTAVAGVISTRPGVSLGAAEPGMEGNAAPQLALAGRVPVKVSFENGTIHPGDLLVASSTPGYAMRAPVNPAPGTVIGKALGKLDSGTGLIDMLVMLR